MVYVALILAEGKYYLMLDKQSTVVGFKSETQGVHYFENAYARAHLQGQSGSATAAINNMTFQPSIVGFESPEVAIQTLHIVTGQTCYRIGNVSGSMIVADLDQEFAAKLWESGTKPRMMPF